MLGLLKTAVKIGTLVAGTGLVLGIISRAENQEHHDEKEPEHEAH